MVSKIINFTLILIVSALLGAQSSPSTPIETDKLVELAERLDRLQTMGRTKMKTLESENEMLATKFDDLKMENAELKSDVKELKVQISKQDEEILLLKSHVTNLESLLAPNRASNDGTNSSSYRNDEPSTRSLSGPPSSCQELKDKSNNFIPIDGIHLLKNKNTNKIEAAFCRFPSSYSTPDQTVSQSFIGNVDVKTKTANFYVQKKSNFGPSGAVLPFELARLNEGDAFDLSSSVFTVPVPGIYHFDFSATKDASAQHLSIYLQVNGVNIGRAYTNQYATGSEHVVSLSASLRLVAGDRVNLFLNNGVLYDDGVVNHRTHFNGWLVEEDLM